MKKRRPRTAGSVMAALLLFTASCSGDTPSAVEAPTAEVGEAPAEQAPTPVAPSTDGPTDGAAPDDEPVTETADAPSDEPTAFEACSTVDRQPMPIAADANALGSRWNTAIAAVAPDELTPFDTATGYSVADEDRIPDGTGSYVGDRAFLTAVSRSTSAIDTTQLILDPDSPVTDSAVRAFISMVLGPDAPDGAVDQVIDSITLWRSDSTISESVVFNCYWQTGRQPLTTDKDDIVLTLSASAAETTQYGNGDLGDWLFSQATRTSTTLFVRDAQRWSGQSDS